MKDVSSIICIYPKDETTEFLYPVYNAICSQESVTGIMGNPMEDDDYLDSLEQKLRDANGVIFLGHGSSSVLYGPYPNELIVNENVCWLENKKTLLFSCRSTDFIKHYKLNQSIGFGIIPTSLDDVREVRVLHKVDISELERIDIDAFKKAIVNIWLRTLKEVDINQIANFFSSFKFYTNVEIVNVLINRTDLPHYKIIADLLYYLQSDMDYLLKE